MLSPRGAGERTPLRADELTVYRAVKFLPGGRSVLISARGADTPFRVYLRGLDAASPLRPVCGDNMLGPAALSPDGTRVVTIRPDDRSTWICTLADGRATRIAELSADDFPFQWSADGRTLFIRRRGGELPLRLFRFDLETHARQPLLDIRLADAAGVESIVNALMTPDARSYVYTYFATCRISMWSAV